MVSFWTMIRVVQAVHVAIHAMVFSVVIIRSVEQLRSRARANIARQYRCVSPRSLDSVHIWCHQQVKTLRMRVRTSADQTIIAVHRRNAAQMDAELCALVS